MDYAAYGLHIRSPRALHFAPWAGDRSVNPSLELRWGDALWASPPEEVIHRMPDYPGGPILLVWTQGEDVCIDYAGWQARFTPGAGRIDLASVDPVVDAAHVAERVWVPFYAMCSFDDVLALHGSAVEVSGRACVILGASGAGKSTTALACVAQGAALLSDDMVLVDVARGVVFPAAPTLRLWQPPTSHIEVVEQARISPASDKRWYKLSGLSAQEVPLGRVLLLERSLQASVCGDLDQLRGMEAMISLLSNAFDWEHPPSWWARARLRRARGLLASHKVEVLRFAPDPQGRPLHVPRVIG